ncbi:MAG: hypothetical protein AAGE52_01580 [Myxococcota bacterium]
MTRIRSIKPEWLDSEKLSPLSDEARLLSIALLALSDDWGGVTGHPALVAARVWPFADDGKERASRAISELAEAGYLTCYEVRGRQYIHLIGWFEHQKVDKPGKPRVPFPLEPVATPPRKIRERFENVLDKWDLDYAPWQEAQESPGVTAIRESFANESRPVATDRDQDRDQDPDRERERERSRTRPPGGLGQLPHPSGTGTCSSSEAYVIEAWVAEGERAGILSTSSEIRNARKHFLEIERRALELAPTLAKHHDMTTEQAFTSVVRLVMESHRQRRAERAEARAGGSREKELKWQPGWLLQDWDVLIEGVVPGRDAA